MDRLTDYAKRPVAFLLRYVRRRHAGARARSLFAVVGAVGCSVSTQYGVKFLVDTLSAGPGGNAVWLAFALLVSLIAADNLLWRVAGWIASHAFVGVTGDLRSDLFRHLTGHAPSYFSAAPGRHADRPHHGDLQRRVRRREPVHLERPAALPGDDLAPSPFSPSSASRWRSALSAIAARRHAAAVSAGARGTPLHHGFANRAAGSTASWST